MTLVMTPDVRFCCLGLFYGLTTHALSQVEYDSRLRAVEESKLKAVVDSLTEEDREKVYQQGLQLESAQNRSEDVSCLPSVAVSGELVSGWTGEREGFGNLLFLCLQMLIVILGAQK